MCDLRLGLDPESQQGRDTCLWEVWGLSKPCLTCAHPTHPSPKSVPSLHTPFSDDSSLHVSLRSLVTVYATHKSLQTLVVWQMPCLPDQIRNF